MSVPRCVIFAGPNGSGKSTLVHRSFGDASLNVPQRFINADDIARDLTTGSQLEKEKAAFRQARQLREEYRLAGLSFSFETVFSHPSTLLDLIKLRAAGYETLFVFVATDNVETNVRRVKQRFISGGHDVPVDKIRSRYERAFQFLPLAAEIADRTVVWDNTIELRPVYDVQYGWVTQEVIHSPLYKSRFFGPLVVRREERGSLSRRYPSLEPVGIERGVYSGPVVEVQSHYCVQTVDSLPILHDRTLLTSDPPHGETVRITYRDGYGTIETISASAAE